MKNDFIEIMIVFRKSVLIGFVIIKQYGNRFTGSYGRLKSNVQVCFLSEIKKEVQSNGIGSFLLSMKRRTEMWRQFKRVIDNQKSNEKFANNNLKEVESNGIVNVL